MNVLSFIDPNLLPWILVANVAGYWLKQKGMPRWMPPIPLVLFLANFIVCTLVGWTMADAEGWKAMVIAILEYGVGNGLAITLAATFGYDIVHSFTKRHVRKKEAEEGNND